MLEDLASHTVPLIGYPMAHVFLAEDGQLPSPEHLDQIRPLDRQAAKFLCDFEDQVKLTKFAPDSGKYFRKWESTDRPLFDAEASTKKWLYQRGIPFSTTCLISFGSDCAFMLTWKMVVHYCNGLFFDSDVVVWNPTLNWALYYDHHVGLFFATDRIYDGEAEQLRVTEILRRNGLL